MATTMAFQLLTMAMFPGNILEDAHSICGHLEADHSHPMPSAEAILKLSATGTLATPPPNTTDT